MIPERRVEGCSQRRYANRLRHLDDVFDASPVCRPEGRHVLRTAKPAAPVISPWFEDARPGFEIVTCSSGVFGFSIRFIGFVSQIELIGVLFSASIQARYTAGLNEEPGWWMSAIWSIDPATRTSETHVGSMFGT